MRAAILGITLAAAACAPEKERQLESGRRYLSTTYSDSTFETFGRTDRAVTGVLVSKTGDSVRFRIRTAKEGLVSGVDITLHPASRRGEEPKTMRVAMPKGTLPVMQNSVACFEQLLRRARVVGGDSVSIPVMFVGAQASLDVFTMIKNGGDSVVLVGPDGKLTNALHLAVDSLGRILGGVIPISGTRILDLSASP